MKLLTKSDMIEFYTTYIAPSSPSRAKLAVYLIAQGVSEKTQDGAATESEAVKVPGNGTEAVPIGNVRDYKSRLVASAGARPVNELGEFEDLDSKL